jgi:hypothetical protein
VRRAACASSPAPVALGPSEHVCPRVVACGNRSHPYLSPRVQTGAGLVTSRRVRVRHQWSAPDRRPGSHVDQARPSRPVTNAGSHLGATRRWAKYGLLVEARNYPPCRRHSALLGDAALWPSQGLLAAGAGEQSQVCGAPCRSWRHGSLVGRWGLSQEALVVDVVHALADADRVKHGQTATRESAARPTGRGGR